MTACLGIDVGGTNTKAALVDESGAILASHEVPTRPDGSLEAIVSAIAAASADMRGGVSVACIALPGIVDDASGRAIFVPNLGWFEPVDVAEGVKTLLGVTPRLANDAVAAAVGEAHFGAGQGLSA